MRGIFVLLLACSFLSVAVSDVWADDTQTIMRLFDANKVLTSDKDNLWAQLLKAQQSLATTQAMLDKAQKELTTANENLCKCQIELSQERTKTAELECTKKAVGDLKTQLKKMKEKAARAEKKLKRTLPHTQKEDGKVNIEKQPEKVMSIIFHNRASFLCERGGMPSSLDGRPAVLIHPDMKIDFDSQGEYSISFAVESPQTDVTLNLEFVVPFYAPVEKITSWHEVVARDLVPSPESGMGLVNYEARVVVPPIRISSNKGAIASETTQYYEKRVWASGNSAGLALVYECTKNKETLHIPVGVNVARIDSGSPRRSGTATIGTIVK